MKISVKGTTYNVERVDDIENSPTAIGRTMPKKKKIEFVECEISEYETLCTIIHELMHAYLYETGVRLLEQEEEFCYWIESVFIEMQQNLKKIAKKYGYNPEVKQ